MLGGFVVDHAVTAARDTIPRKPISGMVVGGLGMVVEKVIIVSAAQVPGYGW